MHTSNLHKAHDRRRVQHPFDYPSVFSVHVAALLDESWSERLGGLELVSAGSKEGAGAPVTVLVGSLEDQSALHGVLKTLHENNIPLLFVAYLGPA